MTLNLYQIADKHPELSIYAAVEIETGMPTYTVSYAIETSPPYRKVPIPASLRWDVMIRDGFKCCQCGSQKYLEIDHVYPESRGGLAKIENLQKLCRKHNAKKGTRV
jgi:5-methylcytosine-specific restriction endonuclease McrA